MTSVSGRFGRFIFLFSFLTHFFRLAKTDRRKTDRDNSVDVEDVEATVPKKKAKKKPCGTVNYNDKKNALKAVAQSLDRQRTYELGVEYAKLSTTSKGENAVDSATSSWVTKLRASVKAWNNCIDDHWKDRGGKEAFLANNGTALAYANYTCRCAEK